MLSLRAPPADLLRRYLASFRKHDRRLWALVAVQFAVVAGFSASMSFFALYLSMERHVPMGRVGLIIMLASLGSAPVQAFAGEVSDRIGRRPLIAWPLAVRALVFFGMSALIAARAHYLLLGLMLLLARALGAVFLSAADAMLADIVPVEDRVEGYSLIRTGGNLGWAAGPAFGGFAAQYSYPLLFTLTGITSLVAAAIAWRGLAESRSAAPHAGIRARDMLSVWRDPAFTLLSVATLLLFVVMGQMVVPLSIYSIEWRGLSKVGFGYLCSLNGLLVVCFQHPLSFFYRRGRETGVLLAGSALFAAGYLAVGWARSFLFFACCTVITTVAEMLFVPTSVGLAARMASSENRGRYLGAFGLVRVLGWAMAPWVGGLLLGHLAGRPRLVWGAVSLIAVAAMLLYAAGARLFAQPGAGQDATVELAGTRV